MKEFTDEIRKELNMLESSDVELFQLLRNMTDYVYTKKLELIEKDPTSLDLQAEKAHADKCIENFLFKSGDNAKMKFFTKLYIYLEDYEKLAVINNLK